MCLRLVCLAVSTAVLAPVAEAAAAAPSAVVRDRYGDPLPHGAVARLGTARLCCDRPRCLAFTTDGKALLSGGADGFVHIWDTRTGKELRRFRAQPHYAFSLAVSPDGKHFAVSASEDNGISLRDLATGKQVRRFRGPARPAFHLAFSPDGKFLASACSHDAFVWEVATAKQVHRAPAAWSCLVLPGPAVAFSRDGKLLAVAAEGKRRKSRIDLWDTSSWKLVRSLIGHTALVVGLAFTADGKRLVSGSDDGSVRLWDVVAGKQLRCHHEELGPVGGVVLACDGKVLAACITSGEVHAWDTASGKELWSADLSAPVQAVAVSPDGKTLAAAAQKRIGLWQAATGKTAYQSPEPAAEASSVQFTPDGKGLVIVRGDDSVEQWDVRACLRRSRTKVAQSILALHVLGNHDMVAAVEVGRNTDAEGLELRRLPADKLLARLPIRSVTAHRINWAVALLPDGSRVAAQTSGGALLWSASSKSFQRFGNRQEGPLALSPDGNLLASSAESAGLCLWDVETAVRLATPGQHEGTVSALRFAPDGRSVLAWDRLGPPTGLRLWEVASGKQRLHLRCRHRIHAASFSPDGRFLALSGYDSGIHLHDLAGGKEVSRLDGHRGSVLDLAFSPDGKLLATAGEDTTVVVWDASRLVGSRQRHEGRLSSKRLEQLWQDLASADAERAHRAVWALADHPEQAVAFLARHLRPAGAEAATARRLIADLDDDSFAVREKASRHLARMGWSVCRLLRQALKNSPSPEAGWRIRQLLRKLLAGERSADDLRQVRAREALWHIGTPEARRLLACRPHRPCSPSPTRRATARARPR